MWAVTGCFCGRAAGPREDDADSLGLGLSGKSLAMLGLRRRSGSCDLDLPSASASASGAASLAGPSAGGGGRELRKSASGTSTGSSSLIPAAWQRGAGAQPQQQQQQPDKQPDRQQQQAGGPGPSAPQQQQQQQQQPQQRAQTPASEDVASTSYPAGSWWDGAVAAAAAAGDDAAAAGVLSATVTSAREAESALDFVLEGSAKSAGVLFARYDMDLDGHLRKQDLYDLLLELNLALPYEEYQRLIDFAFAAADQDRDGRLAYCEFLPLYKLLCLARRAFKRQDHHWNGQIDRYDFTQLMIDLGVLELPGSCRAGTGGSSMGAGASGSGGRGGTSSAAEPQASSGGVRGGGGHANGGGGSGAQRRQQPKEQGRLRELVEHGFSMADRAGRGTVNFGQVLCWYAQYLAVNGGVPRADEYGCIAPPSSGMPAPPWAR